MNNLLFVYGTLDSTWFEKNKITTKVLGRAHIYGLKLKGTEYPAVIPATEIKKETIYGSVIELIHPRLAFCIIDEYEEYYPRKKNESLYVRERTQAVLENKEIVSCWIYWYRQ